MPDTRRSGFAAEAERQAKLVNEADARDPDLPRFMDAALAELLADLDDREGRE